MTFHRVVETDNFGGDYPNEKFVGPLFPWKENAQKVADAINESFPPDHARYYKVVDSNYELKPGFEP